MIPLWLVGFATGGFFVYICLTVTQAVVAPLNPFVPRYSLPPRLSTLADYGRVREVRPVDWGRARARVAPWVAIGARIPLTWVRRIIAKYVDDVARWVMFPVASEDFAKWWEESCEIERKRQYHGRRRYDEMSLKPEWRTRWAEYETQDWPTLSTSGNAWELVPTLTPMCEKTLVICSGMTFNPTAVMSVEHVARNLSENPRLLHAV